MNAPSATKVGLAPTRLPAAARDDLLLLARRVIERYRRATSPLESMVMRLADGLERALLDLALAELHVGEAERAIVASGARVGELARQVNELEAELEAMRFSEPTRPRESSADIQAEIAAFEGQSTVVR